MPEPESSSGSHTAGSGKLLSPLVRRLVDEHRLDPDTIAGTGVGGRITREDVLDAVDAAASRRGAAEAQGTPQEPQPEPPQEPQARQEPPPQVRQAAQVPPMRPGQATRWSLSTASAG
ncbi:MAG: E3 binding domain-containing protein [Microthrixaceae bacterium]|nr:E3 binding domain-containing protein [Microthrixaceae bacterium]